MSFITRDERNNRDALRSVETFKFDTTTRRSLIFILSRCRHLPFENYNNKECRHLYTDSLSTITGVNVDTETLMQSVGLYRGQRRGARHLLSRSAPVRLSLSRKSFR